jgi:heat shock protein HtpX
VLKASIFEKQAIITGFLLLVAGTVLAVANELAGGPAQAVGTIGLGTLAIAALSRAARLYRADAAVAMPASVGRVRIRVRPARVTSALTAVFAVVLPCGATVAFVALTDWGWLAIGGLLLVAALSLALSRQGRVRRDYDRDPPRAVTAMLERLCMRADVPVPGLVLESAPSANAWTTEGAIHLTPSLLELLDEAELEAVLAHELAHLAHRDAAVMDVCSAPSRLLLSFAGLVGTGRLARMAWETGAYRAALTIAVLSVLSAPPAFVFGWVSRLSVLGMSRSREFAADAAPATLTGRPSALVSALMKLDDERAWVPRRDLREAEARSVLRIVATRSSRLGRVFSSHPPTTARIGRLREIEARLQG